MSKLAYAGMIALVGGIFIFTLQTIAAQTEYSWTVPAGAEKLNVKSVRDGEVVLNYTFKVEPGQTFKVEVVK